jgi:threonine dehydratase
MISLDDVRAAAGRLDGVAHRTPVLTSRTLDREAGARVFCKAECFQRGGAFKFRGAYSMISSLPPERLAPGVAAYSSGNHAQAVALAASLLGAPATILMPDDVPVAKLEATRGYGAEVVGYDRYGQDREALGSALAAERGLTLVPPYEHPLVMAGQGTVALELLERVPELGALLVPVGGGGLLAGCVTVAKALRPGIRVIGVEPEAGDDTRRSLAAGERVRIDVPVTIADGQQADIPGELTFEVNRRLVDEVVVVSDAEIVAAMRFVFDRMKVVLEPSGACALAALLAGRVDGISGSVGVVLSGGNVGADRFATLISGRAKTERRQERGRDSASHGPTDATPRGDGLQAPWVRPMGRTRTPSSRAASSRRRGAFSGR